MMANIKKYKKILTNVYKYFKIPFIYNKKGLLTLIHHPNPYQNFYATPKNLFHWYIGMNSDSV